MAWTVSQSGAQQHLPHQSSPRPRHHKVLQVLNQPSSTAYQHKAPRYFLSPTPLGVEKHNQDRRRKIFKSQGRGFGLQLHALPREQVAPQAEELLPGDSLTRPRSCSAGTALLSPSHSAQKRENAVLASPTAPQGPL